MHLDREQIGKCYVSVSEATRGDMAKVAVMWRKRFMVIFGNMEQFTMGRVGYHLMLLV